MPKSYFSENIRRAELLAKILNGETITKSYAAEEYGVEEITINRDLQFFRALGIEIFGRKNGIQIFNKVDKELLVQLASEYFSLKMNSDFFKKSMNVFSRLDKNFYQQIVLLTKAVKESRIIKITYRRLSDDKIKEYTLNPIRLIETDNNWILHAIKQDELVLKLFYLSRIIELHLTNKKIELLAEIDENKKKFEIVLKFNPEVENDIYYKIWFDEFEISRDKDGYIILTTEQPITNKLASWCVSWWDKIEIIEPKELKIFAKKIVNSFLLINS